MTELKIYKHFRDELAKMGKISRAWFTTFNLDISFFERYILSALTGRDPSTLTRLIDFEAMNQELLTEEDSNPDKLEVRIFYDYRALQATNKPKQTAVFLHPIDSSQIRDKNGKKRFGGVFHPKVAILENEKRDFWLMVSSANLTFGGWARNRETFFSSRITYTGNARELGGFLYVLARTAKIKDSSMAAELQTRRFGASASGWYFLDSISGEYLVDNIKDDNGPTNLRVWSPYFSSKLDQIIKNHLTPIFNQVEIIPSKNESQKIWIDPVCYEKTNEIKNIRFMQEKPAKNADSAFVHAKVWLTPKRIAVGSWNMTEAGLNITKNNTDNIEAGVLIDITPSKFNRLLEDYPAFLLKTPALASLEELAEEKENILDNFQLPIELLADWKSMTITLVRPTPKVLLQSVPDGSTIKLPGGMIVIPFRLEQGISFRTIEKAVLYDRMFELRTTDGIVLFRGYLLEKNLDYRSVYTFKDLDDFMKGWLNENPEESSELHVTKLPADGPIGDELTEQTRKILLAEDSNPWFASFQAFSGIRKRINEISALNQKQKHLELIKIGRTLPGSLSELRIHIAGLQKIFEEKPENLKKSPVYLWYITDQANRVFKIFNNQTIDPEEQISYIKNFDLLKLKPTNESELQWKQWEQTMNSRYLNEYAD